MHTWIYKGALKEYAYLYVTTKDNFECVPNSLLKLLGKLDFVLDMELDNYRNLAQANIEDVRQQLDNEGYYLQLSPGDFTPEKVC